MNQGLALLLVDLQRDFVDDPGLFPPAPVLVERVKNLLSGFRSAGIAVIHVQTIVASDGAGAMPHWQRNHDIRCIAGSHGAGAPDGLEPLPGEPVYKKSFYSAFGNPALDDDLRRAGVTTLYVAGVHTHSCVQATLLDAYQRGYAVNLVADAVASYSPLHADLTVRHWTGKACQSVTVADVVQKFPAGRPPGRRDASVETFPVAFIGGAWIGSKGRTLWEMRDPCQWSRITAIVPAARTEEAIRAASLSKTAQADWAGQSDAARGSFLKSWIKALACRQGEFVDLLIREVGKPRTEAEAEFAYALRLIGGCSDRFLRETPDHPADGVTVFFRPRGVVAVITPWNNPLALPVGKLAPALAYGNTVVWKPALQSPALVRLLIASLADAGAPPNSVNVLMGDAETARVLITSPDIDAVSFTGSEQAGREISVACALRGIPLQAELGGNNAALVAADADIAQAVKDLALAAFSFSGQRCTAPRRFIVEAPIFESFCEALVACVRSLTIGDPGASGVHLGPLISRDRQDMMSQWVRLALRDGAKLIAGGRVPPAWAHGCWFEPTVLCEPVLDSAVVREETFGPLAVLLKVKDLDQGIEQVNAVRQGLRVMVCSKSPEAGRLLAKRFQAGLVHLNGPGLTICVDAPFSGWKTSGLGLPEHGRWDRDFYTRTQAVYER